MRVQGLLMGLVVALVRLGQLRLNIAPVWSLPVAIVALGSSIRCCFQATSAILSTISGHWQVVDITGVIGLSAIVGFWNGAAFELLEAKTRKRRISVVPGRRASRSACSLSFTD
jgi:apolipoprotein N-acyltransferase